MPERLVRERTRDRVPRYALRAALPAPRGVVDDAALQHRPIGLEQLPDSLKAELVETAERGEVRGRERRVVQVEVFRQMGSVRTSILEDLDVYPRTSRRPRLHPQLRRAAKLANRAAKKISAFDGVCVWPATKPEWRESLMRRLPTSEVWGIASRLEKRLRMLGIENVWDLSIADPTLIRKRTSVVTMRTALELRGISCIDAEEDRTGKKDQLIVSRSFSEKVTTVAGIRQALSVYAQQAATRLVKHSQVAKTLQAFAGTSHCNEMRHYPAATIRLPFPTADPVELTRAAHQLLTQIQDGTRYARAGIMLTDLLPAATHMPLDMFRQAHEDAGIATLIDDVQRSVGGRDYLGLGYAGLRPGPSWTMKRQMLTRRATTYWGELVTARA